MAKVKQKPEEITEETIKERLLILEQFIQSIQRDQRASFSMETNHLLSLITSSVGKHFNEKSTTLVEKNKLLNITFPVVITASKWVDDATSNDKNIQVQELLSQLKPIVLSFESSVSLFRRDKILSAAVKLLKDLEQFKTSFSDKKSPTSSNQNSSQL